MQRIAPRTSLIDRKFFTFYNKDKTVLKKDRVKDQAELFMIARKIWEVTANRIIINTAGVVLDKVGYFCNWVTPKKRVMKVPRKGELKTMMNSFSKNYFYNTGLFTQVFNEDYLKGWSLDKSASSRIKKSRFRELKKGHKYQFMWDLVNRLYNIRYKKNSI